MKTILIEDVVYVCALYVVRAGPGWQVRIPGMKTEYFSDGVHGSHELAYNAAVAFRRTLLPITDQARPLSVSERSTKKHQTNLPGVFLSRSERTKRMAASRFPTGSVSACQGRS